MASKFTFFLAFLLLLVCSRAVSASYSTVPYNCSLLVGANITFLAIIDDFLGGGRAVYFRNGTVITYALDDNLIYNKGNYVIKNGQEICEVHETFYYPSNAGNVCNLLQWNNNQNITSFIGCNFNNQSCPENCDSNWQNWFSARVVNYFE